MPTVPSTSCQRIFAYRNNRNVSCFATGKPSVLLEKFRPGDLPLDVARELASLGDLQDFIDTAEGNLRATREGLDQLAGSGDKHRVHVTLQSLGTWSASTNALRAEMAEKIAGLLARGYPLAAQSIKASARAAKLHLRVASCRQSINDYHAGKIKRDGITEAFASFRTATRIRDL